MSTPKHRLEIYLPLFTNPDSQGKRYRQPPELFDQVLDEIANHFSEPGLTIDFGTEGVYKQQPEKQNVIRIDVFLKKGDIEWLQQKKIEWCQKFQQEDIYIVFFPITVILK